MQIRCPHCHNPIDAVNDDPSGDVSCPSCGSCFNLAKDGQTLTVDGPAAKMLGHFQLLHCLGQGAFGTVWKARDTKLDRVVAIKIPRKENLTEADAEKFLREARAAAQVRHPNIVSVHEVGREGGRIYIASDFIDGASLDEWIQVHPLTVRESAELCAKIAEALHHAHEVGVVHRDLKPQNILVNTSGEPHVADFGLAKRDAGEITMTIEGAILGTPAYMPPEQARGEAHHADRRSDVYSLGVILFRLLTGELPFRGQRQMLIVQILKEEPPALRKLDARIPRDVETICLKCLEKDPARRYQSAAALAADLRRWLTGHPIEARPVCRTERTWRWCHRNPVVASLSATVVLVLLTGMAVSSFFALQSAARNRDLQASSRELQNETKRANAKTDEALANAERERKEKERADAKAEEARKHLYWAQMNLAHRNWEIPQVGLVLDLLEKTRPQPGETDLRGFEWYYWDRLCHSSLLELKGHTSGVTSAAFSPDGKWLASSSWDQTVKVWDAKSGQETLTLMGHTSSVMNVAFHPDGTRLASASYDQTVKVWDATNGRETLTLKGHSGPVFSVAFSVDGKRLASASGDKTVKMWDATSGEEMVTLNGHNGAVNCVEFSADGKRLASGSNDSEVKIWDVTSGQETLSLKGYLGRVTSLAFSRDGKRLVSAFGSDGKLTELKVWDTSSGQATLELKGHTGRITSLALSADGKRLLSGSEDQTVKVWDMTIGQETLTLKGHTSGVTSVAFSPDEKRLASASGDNTVKLWDSTSSQETLKLKAHTDRERSGWVTSLAFSPDGTRLASSSHDRTVKVWDTTSGQETLTLKGHTDSVMNVAFSPDGTRLASGSYDKTVKVWDAKNGQEMVTFNGHGGQVNCVVFSADGTRLASAANGADNTTPGEVKIWDAVSGQDTLTLKSHTVGVNTVAFNADGKSVVSVDDFGVMKVWDTTSGQNTLTLKGRTERVNTVAFNADGKWVASADRSGVVNVWDATSGLETLTLKGHTGEVNCVSFSPDGKRLVSASWDQTVKVWDAMSGQELLTLKGHTTPVESVAFSADGNRLASADMFGNVKLWDARPWTPELRAEREALSLIHLLREQGKGKYRSNLIRAISADQAVSEIVRQCALQFARELQLNEPNPSMVDASFEKDLGTTWKVQTYLQHTETVRVTAEHAKVGKQSLAIAVKDADDVRCMQYIALKARTRYRLIGWVKTRDVVVAQDGGSTGACLSVDGIGISKSVVGTADWQELQFEFDSGDRTEVELGPRLGTNGSICTGTAWFDELSLVELTDESVAK